MEWAVEEVDLERIRNQTMHVLDGETHRMRGRAQVERGPLHINQRHSSVLSTLRVTGHLSPVSGSLPTGSAWPRLVPQVAPESMATASGVPFCSWVKFS